MCKDYDKFAEDLIEAMNNVVDEMASISMLIAEHPDLCDNMRDTVGNQWDQVNHAWNTTAIMVADIQLNRRRTQAAIDSMKQFVDKLNRSSDPTVN